jgi:Transposase DDE domain
LPRRARWRRYWDQVLLINALDEDAGGALSASAKRIGGPLLFGKIWERLGIGDVLSELLKDRCFEFAVERAVFVATLHRVFVSGSDRDCSSWMKDYDIAGAQGFGLHHFYRAMARLGEEIEEKGEDALAPRCVKDAIEEKLLAERRDLFLDLSVVFMDTTSLSFYGEGGETLGEHGYSKDHRPDLKQMILGLVVDDAGRPICTEMWPGNTADVTTLLPVIDRLRQRFSIGRVCVVADRGMISAATIVGSIQCTSSKIISTGLWPLGASIWLAHRGADWLVRTDAAPNIAALFRAAHIALPPRARQVAPPKAAPPLKSAKQRRGRPRRSATPSRISSQPT